MSISCLNSLKLSGLHIGHCVKVHIPEERGGIYTTQSHRQQWVREGDPYSSGFKRLNEIFECLDFTKSLMLKLNWVKLGTEICPRHHEYHSTFKEITWYHNCLEIWYFCTHVLKHCTYFLLVVFSCPVYSLYRLIMQLIYLRKPFKQI